MITGTVSPELTADIHITLVGIDEKEERIEAFVDTGFNGALATSLATIQSLGWVFRGSEDVILADGSESKMAVFRGIVMWKGSPRIVNVLASGSKSSVGMLLLDGSELRIQVKRGGTVVIADIV